MKFIICTKFKKFYAFCLFANVDKFQGHTGKQQMVGGYQKGSGRELEFEKEFNGNYNL